MAETLQERPPLWDRLAEASRLHQPGQPVEYITGINDPARKIKLIAAIAGDGSAILFLKQPLQGLEPDPQKPASENDSHMQAWVIPGEIIRGEIPVAPEKAEDLALVKRVAENLDAQTGGQPIRVDQVFPQIGRKLMDFPEVIEDQHLFDEHVGIRSVLEMFKLTEQGLDPWKLEYRARIAPVTRRVFRKDIKLNLPRIVVEPYKEGQERFSEGTFRYWASIADLFTRIAGI